MEATEATKTLQRLLLVAHTVQWNRRSSTLSILLTSTWHQQTAELGMLLPQGETTSCPQHLEEPGGQTIDSR